jgi:DNA polymerase-2
MRARRDPATRRFLLTRHWRDTPQGTELSFWLATDDGPLQVTLPPQESVAFIPEAQRAQVNAAAGRKRLAPRPAHLKDFHRQPVLASTVAPIAS